jgi:hypothetical protein
MTSKNSEQDLGGTDPKRPEPREAHCQCCGGYAGHGPDPPYCRTCRAAGEHLVTCPMCKERVPRRSFDEVCPDCEVAINELDELAQRGTD